MPFSPTPWGREPPPQYKKRSHTCPASHTMRPACFAEVPAANTAALKRTQYLQLAFLRGAQTKEIPFRVLDPGNP